MNYPQVYFEECKYKIKKIKMSKFIKTDLNKQKKLFCWLWTNKKNSHFADFKQIICQKLFSEKLGDLRDATPCHAIGHFVFWCHYLTYRMPCHASGHLVIYREWYRFERAFLTLRRFLPCTPSCCFQGFPGASSSTSKLAGLHADLQNSPQ